MKEQSRYRFAEGLIYTVLWAFVFTVPVMLSFNGGQFNTIRVQHELVRIFPFFLLFFIHNFFLFGLFSNDKKAVYFVLTTAAIIVFSIVAANLNFFFRQFDLPVPKGPPGPERENMVGRYFYNLIFCILVAGLNLAIRTTFSWMQSQKKFEQLQKESFRTELELLRHQISPHFFMNTLNNIHALIDFDSEKAKDSIVKLSKLMRVLLRSDSNDAYSLKDEIAFIRDYIGLMRIRLSEEVEVQFNYPAVIPEVKIPQLLFISLIENAFIHGIKPEGNSFILIDMKMAESKKLDVIIRNSLAPVTEKTHENSHIGLENAMKRFSLIYGNRYTFEVIETDSEFEVHISLPL